MNVPTLPNLELPCTVKLSGADFSQALKAARQVGDLVNFSIDSNTFTVHVQGSTDSVTVAFHKDELQSLECENPARSQYSLTYLVPMAKVFGPLETVEVGFGENYPLSMKFSFNDGAANVQYFLAPRVENDYRSSRLVPNIGLWLLFSRLLCHLCVRHNLSLRHSLLNRNLILLLRHLAGRGLIAHG